MAIKHVRQVHSNGCFIACMAMLTGKTYNEVFTFLFPDQDPNDYEFKGVLTYDVAKTATDILKRFGCKSKPSKYKKINSVIKKVRKNALVIVRWRMYPDEVVSESNPSMCHCLVFDAETRKILDSGYSADSPTYVGMYANQIDTVLYVDQPKAA